MNHHDDMDDMGDFALKSRNLTDEDAARILLQPQGRPEQGWPVPRQAAEACTELGADDVREPRWAYALDPFFARWPRATTAVVLGFIAFIIGLAGYLDGVQP